MCIWTFSRWICTTFCAVGVPYLLWKYWSNEPFFCTAVTFETFLFRLEISNVASLGQLKSFVFWPNTCKTNPISFSFGGWCSKLIDFFKKIGIWSWSDHFLLSSDELLYYISTFFVFFFFFCRLPGSPSGFCFFLTFHARWRKKGNLLTLCCHLKHLLCFPSSGSHWDIQGGTEAKGWLHRCL